MSDTTQPTFGIDQTKLYDGPEPTGKVSPFPGPKFGPVVIEADRDARSRHDYVAMISGALDVLNARLLALIATVSACAMWGWAVYEPEYLRSFAAIGFSITVLLPLVVLYYRRGD